MVGARPARPGPGGAVAVAQEWAGVAGKRVLITGATGGIGLAAAESLAAQGAHVAIVARSQARAEAAVARIAAAGGTGTEVDVLSADLASLTGVRRLAAEALERYPRLEVLVNNAGAMYLNRQLSGDGIELTWAVNHLAPFLLTTLLMDRLRASAPARIITTSSAAHRAARIPWDDLAAEHRYQGFTRYGQSKLANILFTLEAARRLADTGVTANCFHPGFVATGFGRNNPGFPNVVLGLLRPFIRRPEQGADTLVWLAASPEAGRFSGQYFVDRRPTAPSPQGRDAAAALRLWEESAAAVAAVAGDRA